MKVLIEFMGAEAEALDRHAAASASEAEAQRQAELYLDPVAGLGVALDAAEPPVPMWIGPEGGGAPEALAGLGAGPEPAALGAARSVVVAAEAPEAAMEALAARDGMRVWPNSELTLYGAAETARVDCPPFRPAVSVEAIREALDLEPLWQAGGRGAGVVVGILDEGVNGAAYPVAGGFARPGAALRPGEAAVGSHGSMCAAGVLVAAPEARLYDYPFLGVPRSGGALQMFQAVLDRRAQDGTPHLTTNSYGFVGVPDRAANPFHEVHDANHPLHRKVREVVAAGVACFFAAGNCGGDCPSGACLASGVGPGRSIHAANSLAEVVTVAAVNSLGERVGYSSQGPGMFATEKPDLAGYSHFHGNFGPGRPAGGEGFDSGTSAATPVVAGVAALLLAAAPGTVPAALKAALLAGAARSGPGAGWSRDLGRGVVSAAGAWRALAAGRGLVA